jgi:23S rRNA pseudouridine2605 synthase
MAHAGLCSRRDAERWIEQGRVAVNGTVLATPAYVVKPGDQVTVDGKPLPETEAPRLWRYHKPKGLVTSHKDPQGRKTVFEAVPEELPRVVSVGRLDLNTEGLLLLTTDGELARHLELPSTGWPRRYRVRAHGKVAQADLDRLAKGMTVHGVHYGPVEARIDREQGGNVWLTLGLREGKNREVKRLLEALGLTVNRLIRVSFGPFALGELAPGEVEEVKQRVLKDQLGATLCAELGLDTRPASRGKRKS